MRSRRNRILLGKMLLLTLILVCGLALLGCTGAIPRGWSGAAIADNTLFLGSMEGKLIALNTSSDARLWEVPFETSSSAGGFSFGCAPASTTVALYGTPAVGGDLVYIGGYDGKIYAINSNSGALRWVYPREGNLEPLVGGPVVALGKVYFGSSDGKLYALDAETGDEEWDFPTGDKIWSTPAIDGDSLFIGSFDKKLYALSAADGSKKWEFEAGGAIASTPLVYNNTIYIGSLDRHLYAVDATSGQQIWQFPVDDEADNKPGNWFWAKPVVYSNTIYAGNLDGKVYILNANTGDEIIAAIDLGSPVSSRPVLVDNSVIIASEAGVIYALDTGNNQIKQLANLGEKIYAPLSAGDMVVYIHSQKGILYEVDAQTGAKRQLYPIS
ncbi:Outer membrane protein assembly factor BamB [subsurface metagenome]